MLLEALNLLVTASLSALAGNLLVTTLVHLMRGTK